MILTCERCRNLQDASAVNLAYKCVVHALMFWVTSLIPDLKCFIYFSDFLD